MSIQEFYAAAQKMEFARKFQFRIRTLGPFTEEDLLYVETAKLPGKEIVVKTEPYMGLEFRIPGTTKYTGSDDWAIVFRCDEGLNIRNKMEAWLEQIFDDKYSTGKYGVPIDIVTMDLLGKNMETLRSYEFTGLFPKSVGDIEYDIKDDGEILRVNANFAYQYWRLV